MKQVHVPRALHNWSADPRTPDELGRGLALQLERQEQPIIEEWRRRVAAHPVEMRRLDRERVRPIKINTPAPRAEEYSRGR
ncbi:MAG: hypothetical protein ACRET2_10615 [Steroidobacteraceae bacterium]